MTPWRAVDVEGLRGAAMAPDGLIPLAQADPEAARRVALAAFTERVRRRHWDPLDFGLGIARDHDHHQALPENGPMLGFLINAPEAGVRTVLELVDTATSNWEGSELREVADHHLDRPFAVLLEGEALSLIGNENVMHWHRGDSRVPKALATALMGLEQWLYRKIDADEPVDEILATLMTSRSVAIWGLLVEIACYKPGVLEDPLSPLVSSAALLLADQLYKATDHSYLYMTFDEGELRRLRSWHGMPHRKQTLQELVLQKVLLEGVLTDELAAGRALWDQAPDGEWRFMSARMDPANYERIEVDGADGWQFEAPDWMASEAAEQEEHAGKRLFWLRAPYQLREWIDSDTSPTDEEAGQLWKFVQEQLPQTDAPEDIPPGISSRADIECGVAAALLHGAPEWTFARYDVVSWCRTALLNALREPPPPHEFDYSDTFSNTCWDGFAADALPVLWARDPGDQDLRQAAFRLATHRHHQTVSRFFARAVERDELRGELPRLEHLSLHYARLLAWFNERKTRQDNADWWPEGSPTVDDLPDVLTPAEAIARAFVEGTLDEKPSVADFIAETPAGLVSERADARHRIFHSLGFDYLVAARLHALVLPAELGQAERKRRLGIAADLATVIGGALAEDDDVDGTPYESERALFDRLGAMAAVAGPEAARPIWQPILAAGDAAHYWVSDFVSEVWRAGLAAEELPDGFAETIKEIWSCYAEQERASPRRHRAGDTELAMLCLSRFGYPKMEKRHRPLLAALQPEWSEMVAARLADPYFAVHAVRFFAEPAAADIVADALRWLSTREEGRPRYDESLDEAMAELLAKLSGRDPQLLRRQDDVGVAARTVLAALVARQNAVAMQLSAALGGG